jgi:glycosyltransferase involved in cell wall biosynthesis
MNNTTTFPKVSVITVTYNAEKYLEQTIRSVIKQDYPNIEYIIIDGNSSDKTTDIIKDYEFYLSYWLSEPDVGIYDAMNKGIDVATGEWINFMNAGDSFTTIDAISYLINNLEEDTDLITGDRYSVYEDSSKKILNKASGIKGIQQHGMPSGHQSMLIKSLLMKEYKYSLNYKYASDHDLMLRFYKNNKKFQLVNRPISNYLRGGISDENNIEAYIEILFLMIKYKPYSHSINELDFFKDFFYYNQPKEQKERNNLLFSRQFNKIIEQYLDFLENNENIILYGNGTISNMLLKINSKKIIGILDQNNLNPNISMIPIFYPQFIKNIKYNKIIITVLGREKEIMEYLNKTFSIDTKNIFVFDVAKKY